MKNCFATVLLLSVSLIGFCQSKYDFQTGLDSLAFSHHIKTKRTYNIIIDSTAIDTNLLEIHTYDSSGYLTGIENHDLRTMRRNPNFSSNKKTVKFEYNEDGYLISENMNWGGPKGWWGEDTVKKRITEDWAYIKHTELLISTETINDYPHEETWTERCNYYYLQNNSLDSIVCFVTSKNDTYRRITTYRYDDNKLLVEIQYGSAYGIHRRTSIEYEFYQ